MRIFKLAQDNNLPPTPCPKALEALSKTIQFYLNGTWNLRIINYQTRDNDNNSETVYNAYELARIDMKGESVLKKDDFYFIMVYASYPHETSKEFKGKNKINFSVNLRGIKDPAWMQMPDEEIINSNDPAFNLYRNKKDRDRAMRMETIMEESNIDMSVYDLANMIVKKINDWDGNSGEESYPTPTPTNPMSRELVTH